LLKEFLFYYKYFFAYGPRLPKAPSNVLY